MVKSRESTTPVTSETPLRRITTYQAGIAQASAHRLLQKRCDQLLKPYGITKMQWLIIGAILDVGDEGISISRLTDTLGTTMPYMTTSINLLESKGIVRRINHLSDNRSKLVVLAEDFAEKCAEIEKVLRQGLRQSIYGSIDPEEFRIYIKVLFQLRQLGPQR